MPNLEFSPFLSDSSLPLLHHLMLNLWSLADKPNHLSSLSMRHSEPVGMTFSFNIDDSANALTTIAKLRGLFGNTCFVTELSRS